ncbi:MAG: M15 family metallopeptidase [Legionellales bacterium]|nr:M15 family metallopeptidase [Legionellales bacterium]
MFRNADNFAGFLAAAMLFFTLNTLAATFVAMPIPPQIKQQMIGSTWHPGCPLNINQLSLLRLSYWGFDKQSHEGTLIINHHLAPQVLAIFRELYLQHFPIESMQLIEDYQGKERLQLEKINTTGFNCRKMVSNGKQYSLHSYGIAIDLNPWQNPYVAKNSVIPQGSDAYRDRQSLRPGMINKNSLVYAIFSRHGWQWGGDWKNVKDYMHFERRNF